MRILVVSNQKIWRENFVRYSQLLNDVEFIDAGENFDAVLIDAEYRKKEALKDLIDEFHYTDVYLVSGDCDRNSYFMRYHIRGIFDPDNAIRDIVDFLTERCQSSQNLKENIILEALAQGLSNKQISARYNLPLSTVKYYLRKIYAKMNVRTRTQAALLHDKSRL
jgi:DNA-binding CsgD family transcriptional regulator